MAERKVFFCDWCEAQSPGLDTVQCTWVILDIPNVPGREILCGECALARGTAIREAKARRASTQATAKGEK